MSTGFPFVSIFLLALVVAVLVLIPLGISSFFKTTGQKILAIVVYFLVLFLIYAGWTYFHMAGKIK